MHFALLSASDWLPASDKYWCSISEIFAWTVPCCPCIGLMHPTSSYELHVAPPWLVGPRPKDEIVNVLGLPLELLGLFLVLSADYKYSCTSIRCVFSYPSSHRLLIDCFVPSFSNLLNFASKAHKVR